MMKDVNRLDRFYEPEIDDFLKIAAILRSDDAAKRPKAYDRTNFRSIKLPTRIGKTESRDQVNDISLILTDECIRVAQPFDSAIYGVDKQKETNTTITTSPVMICQLRNKIAITPTQAAPQDRKSLMFQATEALRIQWLCIDDFTGLTLVWAKTEAAPPLVWIVEHIFTTTKTAEIFIALHPKEGWKLKTLNKIIPTAGTTLPIHGVDSTFTPCLKTEDIFTWLKSMKDIINALVVECDTLNQGLLWIPLACLYDATTIGCTEMIQDHLPLDWQFLVSQYNSARSGDFVAAQRMCIHLWSTYNGT